MGDRTNVNVHLRKAIIYALREHGPLYLTDLTARVNKACGVSASRQIIASLIGGLDNVGKHRVVRTKYFIQPDLDEVFK